MATTVITITDANEVLQVEDNDLQIVVPGVQGPPGPPGASSDTAYGFEEQRFSLLGNQTVFTLSYSPRAGSLQMYLNGIHEPASQFSLSGMTVTVTGFTPTTGDIVDFYYQRSL